MRDVFLNNLITMENSVNRDLNSITRHDTINLINFLIVDC